MQYLNELGEDCGTVSARGGPIWSNPHHFLFKKIPPTQSPMGLDIQDMLIDHLNRDHFKWVEYAAPVSELSR
jgi:hypothetical protein